MNKIGKGLLSRGRPTTHKPKPPKARAQSKILRLPLYAETDASEKDRERDIGAERRERRE